MPSLRHRLLSAVNRWLGPPASSFRARAAYDPDADHSDAKWYRKIGGAGGQRDMPSLDRSTMVNRGLDFTVSHPLANRACSAMQEWTSLDEVVVEAADPRVQGICDEVLADPRSDWRAVLRESLVVAMGAGTLCYPARVTPGTGVPYFDWFDPAELVGAEYLEGSNRIVEYYLRAVPGSGSTAPEKVKNIIAQRDRRQLHTFGRLMGHDPRQERSREHGVMVFRFNAMPGMAFGVSDFWPGMDGWTRHEDILDRAGERAQVLASYTGSVEVNGDADDIRRYREEHMSAPTHAQTLVHNAGIKPNLMPPPVADSSLVEFERILRNTSSAPVGIPPHILVGDFSDGNRAVATAANDPAYLRAKRKQEEMSGILRTACRYAVDSVYLVNPARLAGMPSFLDDPAAWAINVRGPKLLRADPKDGAPILVSVTQALMQAMGAGLIDKANAQRIFARVVPVIGVEELDVAEVSRAVADAGATPGEVRALEDLTEGAEARH